MKIIKEGDLSLITTVRRFVCPDCECIWEVSGFEYLRTVVSGHRICESNCPTCKKLVRIEDE